MLNEPVRIIENTKSDENSCSCCSNNSKKKKKKVFKKKQSSKSSYVSEVKNNNNDSLVGKKKKNLQGNEKIFQKEIGSCFSPKKEKYLKQCQCCNCDFNKYSTIFILFYLSSFKLFLLFF